MSNLIPTTVGTSAPAVVAPPLSKAEALEVLVHERVRALVDPIEKASDAVEAAKEAEQVFLRGCKPLQKIAAQMTIWGAGALKGHRVSRDYDDRGITVWMSFEKGERVANRLEIPMPKGLLAKALKVEAALEAAEMTQREAHKVLRDYVKQWASQKDCHSFRWSNTEEEQKAILARAARREIRSAVAAKTTEARVAAAAESHEAKVWASETLRLLGVGVGVVKDDADAS